MTEDIYRKLAQRLDAIPNGFDSTASGVELKLLAKIFSPQEAALAAVMRLTPEPPDEIAARAGLDPDHARRMLKEMVRKGLIRAARGEDRLAYGLMPFVVGIYEYQLPRLDAELATLFEQYVQEVQGGSFVRQEPPVHRIIPVEESIPFALEVFPHEHAAEMLERAKSWGVRDCICRVQQKLIGQPCHHPIENCISFAPVENAFDRNEATRPITKAEALQLLREAEEAGLVHTTGNYRDQNSYICNCCTCSCGLLRAVVEFDLPTAVSRSGFRATVDADLCSGCDTCTEACLFNALSIPDGIALVDATRCVGCGQCTTACTTGALSLERLPPGECPLLPSDFQAWMVERAEQRNIPLSDIL